MTLALFDDQVVPSLQDPRPPDKSHAWYLVRSARPEWIAARRRLEKWYSAFPACLRAGLRSRIRSDDNDNHNGAVFELFMHALLVATGFEVDVEPANAGRGVPEFRLSWGGRRVCFLEATTIHAASDSEADMDDIDRLFAVAQRHVRSRGFDIGVSNARVTSHTPSAHALALFIDRWVATLDVEHGHGQYRVEYLDAASGWKMTLAARPLPDPTAAPSPLLRICTGKAEHIEPEERLLKILKRKRDQHREADLPLVVAVACNDFALPLSVLELADVAQGTGSCCGTRTCRLRDGLWSDSQSQASRHVAGFVWAQKCFSWSLPDRLLLVDNPHLEGSTLLRPWPFDRLQWTAPKDPNRLDEDSKYLEGRRVEDVMPN